MDRIAVPFDTDMVHLDPDPRKGKVTQWWADYLAKLQNKLDSMVMGSVSVPFVTPEDYGGIGDGSTDDTAAVQSALDDGRGVMLRSSAVYLCSGLFLNSNQTIFGLPGATLRQKGATAITDTPFISATGKSNIWIGGVVIDGNKSAQPGTTNVCGLFLDDVDGVVLTECETVNTSGCGVGGLLWKNVQFVGHRASTWGIGNDFAAIYLQDGTFPSLPIGEAYNVLVSGCTLDGSGSGSCVKLTATADAPLSGVRVVDNDVKVGYPGASPPYGTADALGIEIWSGPGGVAGNSFSQCVVANNRIDSEFDSGKTYGRTWGISLSQGTDCVVAGNTIKNCGVLAIELIGSGLVCDGNRCDNCGPISAILSSLMASQKSVQISNNSNVSREGQQYGATPLSAIQVYVEGSADFSRFILSNNIVQVQGAQIGIWVQENGSGEISRGIIAENIVMGDGDVGSYGIALSPDGLGSSITSITVEANHIDGFGIAIQTGGTGQRYLWNIFGTNAANYGGTPDSTSMIVDVSNTEGANFAPPSVQMRGRPAPVLASNGDVFLDQSNDTSRLATASDSVDSNPNVLNFQRVNFGTEIQGGIVAVNSRWAGSPNWTKTSSGAYNRAMFLVLAAARFGVKFGAATNTGDADPGSYGFFVTDPNNSVGEAGGVFTGSGYPLWIEQLAFIRSGSGDPNGSITASPGCLYLRTNGGLYLKTSGIGNTGWTLMPTSSGSGTVTSVGLSLPGIFSVSGSPVTSSGTLAVTLVNQSANRVFAGPSSGGAAAPAFRQLVDDDLAATAWTTYTPTITPTSGTATTTTLAAAYLQQGKKVFYRIYWLGTISIASADMSVSIPVAPISTAAAPLGQAASAFVRVAGSLVGAHAAVFTSPQAIIFGRPGTTFPAGGTSVELCATGVYEAA